MEITNDSGQDTKYRVTNNGGGSGMDPRNRYIKAEETKSWPLLKAGESVNHTPVPPGPWIIDFYVDGKQIHTTARTAHDRVRLATVGQAFKADVSYPTS